MDGVNRLPEQKALEVLSSLSYRTGELNQYLQSIAEGISSLIRLDWSVVTLCKDGNERILASTLDLGSAAEEVYALHGTLTGTVIDTGAPLKVEDASLCSQYGQAPEGYRAYLGVPLRTPLGEVIGTICSFQHQPRRFTAAEVELAEIFAERAATAIDNYQLYQQQQQLIQQLQTEIQERQHTEIKLRQSQEQLHQIADNLDQVLWMYSLEGQPIYVSPAFEKIWQQSCTDWYLHPNICWDSLHPEDLVRVQTAFKQAADGKYCEEYRIIRPDGSIRMIRDQGFPIKDTTGQVCRLAGISEDITESRQSEQSMLKAISALAEVGELAAMIVHEVRNPLTTVLMGLQSLQRFELPAIHKEQLMLALDEAERIRNLLSEILRYAKPQSLQFTDLELNEWIRELLGFIPSLPSAARRRIKFIPAPTPLWIRGDKDKLKQVFINLIDNACEAVKPGEVIRWQVQVNPQKNHVAIQVQNGGDPIPSEVLSQLTKPFYTTKASGTGLGLAIVKRIIDAHAGQLTIASNAEAGTTVTIELPLKRDKSQA